MKTIDDLLEENDQLAKNLELMGKHIQNLEWHISRQKITIEEYEDKVYFLEEKINKIEIY